MGAEKILCLPWICMLHIYLQIHFVVIKWGLNCCTVWTLTVFHKLIAVETTHWFKSCVVLTIIQTFQQQYVAKLNKLWIFMLGSNVQFIWTLDSIRSFIWCFLLASDYIEHLIKIFNFKYMGTKICRITDHVVVDVSVLHIEYKTYIC